MPEILSDEDVGISNVLSDADVGIKEATITEPEAPPRISDSAPVQPGAPSEGLSWSDQQILDNAVNRLLLKERIQRVESPVSSGLQESAIQGVQAVSSPKGLAWAGALAAAPEVAAPALFAKTLLDVPDAVREVQRARETGDRADYYRAIGNLAQTAGVLYGTGRSSLRTGAELKELILPEAFKQLMETPPLLPYLPAKVQPGERGGIPIPTAGEPVGPRAPKQPPIVPETAAEARETVIEAIRKADARTLSQIQSLFPEARLSREQARVFRNIAFPPVVEPVRPQATVADILGKEPPPEEPPAAGGVAVPKQPIAPAGGPSYALPVEGSATIPVRETSEVSGAVGEGIRGAEEPTGTQEPTGNVPSSETAPRPTVPLDAVGNPPEFYSLPRLRALERSADPRIAAAKKYYGSKTIPDLARLAKARFEEMAKARTIIREPEPYQPPAEAPVRTPEEQLDRNFRDILGEFNSASGSLSALATFQKRIDRALREEQITADQHRYLTDRLSERLKSVPGQQPPKPLENLQQPQISAEPPLSPEEQAAARAQLEEEVPAAQPVTPEERGTAVTEGLTPEERFELNDLRAIREGRGGKLGRLNTERIAELEAKERGAPPAEAPAPTPALEPAGEASIVVTEHPDGFKVSGLSVPPSERGKGIGTAKMQEVIDKSKATGKPIFLTAVAESPAVQPALNRFYERLGFKHYRDDPLSGKPMYRYDPPPPEPAKPSPAPTAPAVAQARAQAEVTRVAATEGKRSAKDVKAELLKRIEDAMRGAPEASAYSPGKHGVVEINIPGDGNFKILRNLKALGEIRERVQKLKTDTGIPPTKISTRPLLGRDFIKSEASRMSEHFKGDWQAWKALEDQKKAAELDEKQLRQIQAVQSELGDRGNAEIGTLQRKSGSLESEILRLEDRFTTRQGEHGQNVANWPRAIRDANINDTARLKELRAAFKENEAQLSKLTDARQIALTSESKPPPETPAVPPPGPPTPPREFGMAAGGFGGRGFGLDMANLWQDIKALWQRRPIKRDMAQLADAMIDTIPANKGREAGNDLRVLTKERTGGRLVDNALARKAAVFVIQAKGDPAKLATDLPKVAGNAEAEAAIRYAQANWDALQPLAERTKLLLDNQIGYERANGIDTEYENHYVPQRHENILTDRGVLFGEVGGKSGSTGFKKAKVFPDYATAIEAGYKPRNLDIADLVEHRVRTGQRLVNRKLWADGFKTIDDPFSGEPIVADMVARRIPRPDGTVDMQYSAPQGYVPKEIIPGIRIAVRQGYSHLFDALTGTSQIRQSVAGRAGLAASGWLKHQLLLLDSFHASRTMQTSLAARGSTSYGKGISLLEYSDRALTDAVNHNLITSEMASWVRTPQPFEIGGRIVHMTPREVAQLGQKNGLNVGRFADALYNEAKGVVGTNPFSRWLFEKLTRGAMTETFLSEFGRVSKANPTMDATAVARKVSRDINVLFGNLQRQSIIKNPAIRDLMQMAFLAPQWVESLARRELRAVGQAGQTVAGLATGKGLQVGTVAKTIGTGLAAYVALTQLMNFISRGHSTLENPEDEHKLDAFIPDPSGEGEGFWFSPLSVFGEITHDIIRYSHTEPTAGDVPQRIRDNKLGPVGRSLAVLSSGEDPMGTKLPTTWDRVKESGLQLVPLPIGAKPLMQTIGSKLGVEGVEPPKPGTLTRQAAGSLGFKIEPYRADEARIKRARQVNTYIEYWTKQARQLPMEQRRIYIERAMSDANLSPLERNKAKRKFGEAGVFKYR